MKTLIVIFGVTGNLSRTKILPAIAKLESEFFAVGVGRSQVTDNIFQGSQSISDRFSYFRMDLKDDKRFKEFSVYLDQIQEEKQLDQRLYYFAVSPKLFDPVTEQMKKFGMTEDRNVKVVFEKPFGKDLDSSRKLNRFIKRVFDEEQVYRTDHYMSKELVQNILALRFANIFEKLWDKNAIDHVQIILAEDEDVSRRAAYYDEYGAVKDVFQNHMLQVLGLCAMDKPDSLSELHRQKRKLLEKVRPVKIETGQYKGYKSHDGVMKDSQTETFAAVKLYVDSKRWEGVPFYLFTGKELKQKYTAVYVQFKQKASIFGKTNPNSVTIEIYPRQGYHFKINTKVPGEFKVEQSDMDFCHECRYGPNTPNAYHKLFKSAIKGDKSIFISFEEIQAAWKVVDELEHMKTEPFVYDKKTYPEVDFFKGWKI